MKVSKRMFLSVLYMLRSCMYLTAYHAYVIYSIKLHVLLYMLRSCRLIYCLETCKHMFIHIYITQYSIGLFNSTVLLVSELINLAEVLLLSKL